MRPRPTDGSDKSIHLPESQCKRATKHSVALTAIYKADRVDEKDMLAIELSCRDLRRIYIRFDSHQQQSTGSDPRLVLFFLRFFIDFFRNQILHHLSLFTPEKKENIFAYQYFETCRKEKTAYINEPLNQYGYYRYNHQAVR